MNNTTGIVQEKVYYPYYDYIRFIAASVVMFGHANLITWSPAGSIAVDVFFTLSGWLIGNILIKTHKNQLPQFYFNRVIRIWIPYFISFFIVISLSLIKDDITLKWIEIVFYKATFVYNIFGPSQLAEYKNLMPLDGTANHFWSVNAEEQFYLFAPILLVITPIVGRSIFTWILLVIAAMLYDIYAPIFAGVLLAILVDRNRDFERKKLVKPILIILLSISVILFIYNIYMTVASVIFSAALIMLLKIPGQHHKAGVFLGGISYSLYLNHWMGEFLANFSMKIGLTNNITIRYLISFISAYIIASIIYLTVEKYCIRMRPVWYNVAYGKLAVFFAYSTVAIGILVGTYFNIYY
ncbi:acyltransferase family protein [Nitrincola schmidtii]|uniref:acyltransferase family protein n=1 Tax=Nitrincola schmidtii TaxID=1730894 RepID=UPI00124DE1B1|nr:acyltransferase [Nitrincola schmidtii]